MYLVASGHLPGETRALLFPPRAVAAARRELGGSKEQVKKQDIAYLILTNYFSEIDPEVAVTRRQLRPHPNLESPNDAIILSTTRKLVLARNRYQGQRGWKYPVGERVYVDGAQLDEIAKELVPYGVESRTIKEIARVFSDPRRTQGGKLPFHVVHFANKSSHGFDGDYARIRSGPIFVCTALFDHKPYYELVAELPFPITGHNEMWRHLFLWPKDLTERVAELHPKPTPLRVYRLFNSPAHFNSQPEGYLRSA